MPDNVRSILIVDDDPNICELARRFLEHHEYRVLTAGDSAGALRTMEIHRPDLLLLDLHLGSEDGLMLLARLKAHHVFKSVPVIMLTAHAGRDLVARAVRTGALDYIVKPFQGSALVGRIARAMQIGDLERSRASAEDTAIQLDRRGGIARILFTGKLDGAAAERLKRVFTPAVRLQCKNDEIVLDLRYLTIADAAQLPAISEMLQYLKPAETRIVAGRNFADLLTLDLKIEEQLFLSADDLVQWLKMRQQKR